MARELRISIVIPLPEGDFEEAGAIMQAKPLLDDIKKRVQIEAGGGAIVGTVEHEIVTPRPRGAKGENDTGKA